MEDYTGKQKYKTDRTAFIKYLCALLLFGLNGIVACHINLNSHEIVFLRTFIGSILLITVYITSRGKFHLKGNTGDAVYIILSGIAMGTSWMFLYEAYKQIGVGFASLLYYCGPVIVMILSPVIFKEPLTRYKITGFIIVLAGIALVNGELVTKTGNTWGIFCGGMSAIMYFFMVTLNKQSMRITGMENAVLQLTVSFITVAVFVGFKQTFIIHIPKESLPWILLLGLVNTGVGCYLYFSSISKLPVQTVAVFGYLEPLSAVIFAALMLGEKMGVSKIVGAACIICGAMIGELFPWQSRNS